MEGMTCFLLYPPPKEKTLYHRRINFRDINRFRRAFVGITEISKSRVNRFAYFGFTRTL